MHSCYGYSPRLLPALLRVSLGIPSPLSGDATLLLKGVAPTPRILNAGNIPPASPFVLVFNHYDRPGLGAWWSAAALAHAIARERSQEPRQIHFLMTREWWYPGGFGRWVKQPLTQWFFGQLSKTYGTICVPPVLGNGEFRGEGAIAIRRALSFTRGDAPQLVGLAPEGHTGANLELCEPPHGTGLFLLMLTHDTIPVLPAGIYEDDTRTLTVNFGAPFQLIVSHKLPRDERDREASRQVMVAISKTLPEWMRGVYGSDTTTNRATNMEKTSRFIG